MFAYRHMRAYDFDFYHSYPYNSLAQEVRKSMSMKLSKKILLVGSALLVAACANPTTSSPVSGTTSSIFVNDTKWDDDVAQLMYDISGDVAPYIALAKGFEYKQIDMEGDPTFYLFSKEDGDLTKTYQRLVEASDYELYGVDQSAGYDRYVYSKVKGEAEVFLQFDYYPGGYNPKGFEIFMWSDIYVNPEIDYPLISDWSKEVKNGFMDKFGEIIPLAPLSMDYEYIWVEEDCNFIFTDKDGHSDALTRYYTTVRDNTDWTFSLNFWNQGYIVFEKKADNVENGLLHLNMRHSNKTGFIVDVWMTIEKPPVLITDWSADVKDALNDLFKDEEAVPVAPISDEYAFDFAKDVEGGYDVIDILDPHPIDDFSEKYIEILENAGFVENDFYFPRWGNHVFEKESSELPDWNIVVDFMVLDAGVSIQIYKEEVLSGTGFTDTFPVDQMKHWMGKYGIEYVEFPTFPSDVDGRYLYESVGPDFDIQIYQDPGIEVLLEETYKDLLEADGWVIDDSRHGDGSYWGYFARKEGCDFYMRFFSIYDEEDIGAFILHVYPNSYDCTTGFVVR